MVNELGKKRKKYDFYFAYVHQIWQRSMCVFEKMTIQIYPTSFAHITKIVLAYKRGSHDAAFPFCFAAECYIKHPDMETKMKNAGLLRVAPFHTRQQL